MAVYTVPSVTVLKVMNGTESNELFRKDSFLCRVLSQLVSEEGF